MSEQKIPCMLLCGGTSKRFGSDKMLAPLAAKPMVFYVIERLLEQVQTLAINRNTQVGYTQFALPVEGDCMPGGLGPLAGILTAMKWADSLGHGHVLTCSGDTPFLPFDWAGQLTQYGPDQIVISASGGQVHPVCALWPTRLMVSLENDLKTGVRGVRQWLETQDYRRVDFKTCNDEDPFFNINTRDDLARAERTLQTSAVP